MQRVRKTLHGVGRLQFDVGRALGQDDAHQSLVHHHVVENVVDQLHLQHKMIACEREVPKPELLDLYVIISLKNCYIHETV